MARRAATVFLVLSCVSAFCSTVAFSVVALYRYRVAGLDDFQLVLVGTVMEATIFVCEVPTGVVADLVSRRLSVIVGQVGMGAALLIEAAFPSLGGVLTGQAIWGLAYTFTSGATVAWVAGELGEPGEAELTSLFLRAGRLGSAAALVGLPVAFGLGAWSLRSPIVAAGLLQIGLGFWLFVNMTESGFVPVPKGDRSTWRHLAATGRSGLGAVRRSAALRRIALVLFIAGGSSEAYDRYHQKHLLADVGIPAIGPRSGLFWLGVFGCASSVLGIVVPGLVRRWRPGANRGRLSRWLTGLFAAEAVALFAFALSGSFLLAAWAALVVERVRSVRQKLLGAWIVPVTPKAHRATVLSALEQADSVSQVTIGPAMGVIGQRYGLPVALLVSAGALVPAIPVVRFGRARRPTPGPPP